MKAFSSPVRPPSTQSQMQQQGGYVLIEFAFALMILLMLTFGMIDLGYALFTANVVQSAAQAGARSGMVDQTVALSKIYERCAGLDLANVQASVTLVDGERIQVEVTYQYEPITPIFSQVAGGGITLTGRASMLIY